MNAARLAEYEALANAATPGPWDYNWDSSVSTWEVSGGAISLAYNDDEFDAAFIAEARTAVPDLATALREARELAERLGSALHHVMSSEWDAENEDRQYSALAAFDAVKETW